MQAEGDDQSYLSFLDFSQPTDNKPFFTVNNDAEGIVEGTYNFELVASVDDGAKTKEYSFSLIIE